MLKTLIDYISTYVELSDAEIDLLSNSLEKRTYEGNEIFFEEGEVADEIYFVTQGCVRLFYNVDTEDKTAFFYTEGQFICAGESYTYHVPARENYQALGYTELYVFGQCQVEELLASCPKFEIIGRVATENELIRSQKIIASFVAQSAEERYLELLNTQADLFQRVPQRYIASFLGISAETLSRIKSKHLRK